MSDPSSDEPITRPIPPTPLSMKDVMTRRLIDLPETVSALWLVLSANPTMNEIKAAIPLRDVTITVIIEKNGAVQ